MIKKTIHAVSIVIPMYNAEKYIGECLDSILAQTFKDFEVIVVDDCSTDTSRAVVESYLPKFNQMEDDKLKLIRRKNNSGSAGTPRNIGISLSRGEYIHFVDSDDMITKTALEELYPIAKKFDADVVHCERYFQFNDGNSPLTLEGYQSGELVKEPTLITEDLSERVKDLYNRRFLWNVWSKMIRRDFILENDIRMKNIAIGEDTIFTCCIVCSAKKYVRVPNMMNIYRVVENSISHKKMDLQKNFHRWIGELNDGFQVLDKFLREREFFQKHPDVKHLAFEVWVRECCGYLQEIYAQIPAWQFDEFIRKEFEDVENKNELMAFIFSRMNVFNVNLDRQSTMIQQMHAHIQQQNQVIKQQQEQIQQLQSQLNKL
ncbi:MAG: glycosyltransferase [Selenomonadaceae bacterium]|nr:glycosyltransferase [Selenomonadaceae bacterium]